MKDWRREILSESEQSQIQQRVAEIESKSHVEVAVAIVRASDPYPAATFRFALFYTFTVSLILSLIYDFVHEAYFIGMQLFILGAAYYLGRSAQIKKFFLSSAEVEREVQEKANEFFHLKGMHQLESQAMIMLYFSLQERKVQIILGRTLQGKVTDTDLQNLLSLVKKNFHQRLYYQGICECLDYIDAHAVTEDTTSPNAKHFSNEIIWGDFSDSPQVWPFK